MADRVEISFAKLAASEQRLGGASDRPEPEARFAFGGTRRRRPAAVSRERRRRRSSKGKGLKPLQLLSPAGVDLDRIVFVGLGDPAKLTADELAEARRHRCRRRGGGASEVTVMLERPDGERITPAQAAEVALGITLRSYSFDKYKTKKKDDDEPPKPRRYTIAIADSTAAEKAWAAASAVAEGVVFARDLVNEPANVLGTGRVRRPAERPRRAWRRRRRCSSEPELAQAQDGRAARRGAGLGAPAARRRHALEGRTRQGQAGGVRRQGRRVRHRRHLDQAGRRHGGHEGRHGRRRRGRRAHAHAGARARRR